MGLMWLDNSADDRFKRLLVKFGASPFLPALAVSKALEAAITDGELATWTLVTVVSFVWFLIAEDLQEYAEQQYDSLQDALEDL